MGRLLLRFAPVVLVLVLVPAIVGLATGDDATGWPLVPSVVLAGLAIFASAKRSPPDDATEGEDAVAVALAFPIGVLASSAPYLTHDLGGLDALFEGMSGLTSTGLTRYSDIEAQPFGLHFLRAWQEWIGGYALVTLTVALLSRAAGGAKEMAQSDVADDAGADGEDKPDMTVRSRRVTIAYAALTVLCIGAVWATGQTFGFSVLHGLTATSTGGFAAQNDSLGSVAPLTVFVLMGFSILGAVALSDYVRPLVERCGLPKLGLTLLALIALSATWGGVVLWAEGGSLTAYEAMQVAASAQTTTGYSVPTVSDMADGSKLALTASMFIGGDVGSTAGGVKLVRFLALGVAIWVIVRHRFGNAKRLSGQKRDEATDALKLLAWWTGFTLLGWLGLVLVGHAPVDALFEWTSALNNVGLSAGVSSGENVPAATRLLLVLAMWLGRVEILAAVLVFRLALRREPSLD